MFKNIKQDIKINYSNISKLVCAHYRLGNYGYKKNNILLIVLYKILKVFVKIYSNSDIHPKANIAKGLRLEHDGQGIVIHSSAIIGENARIFHNVTIGISNDKINKAAIIGNNCFIGTGSVIVGNINIGDNVIIGANSVVTKNIENNITVKGNPAK
ncbi:serine O-acetyltransferase [Macrococcus armenti]|uniref:serine O-acetyltransferase n=1 Tax=Macrococcus armenti TaxID=2875764 RepID=UPI001CD242DA|nr:DapH/DapD/GlmU-related protein [Macrococcus armenti]UBH11663.1 serine acetyltransferase [Macrococcus armenti]